MSATNTALAGLYEAHASELRSFARRRAGGQEAEDIVQDAYLHLLQRGTAATLEHPRAYLYRIAANLAVDCARKALVRLRYAGEGVGLTCNAENPPGPEAAAASSLELQRLQSLLLRTAGCLPRGFLAQPRRGFNPCRNCPAIWNLGAHRRPPYGEGLESPSRETWPPVRELTRSIFQERQTGREPLRLPPLLLAPYHINRGLNLPMRAA